MKILVGIDGSQHAEKAFDAALDLAEKYAATLVIISVVPSVTLLRGARRGRPLVPLRRGEARDMFYKELKASHEEVLSEALEKAKEINPNLNVSTKLAEGHPAGKIIETAKEGNFDLIVVGSRGLGGISKFFLGSVSQRVVNEAECPVLIIK